MEKQIVVYSQTGIPHSHEKEWHIAILNTTDESQTPHVQWKNSHMIPFT